MAVENAEKLFSVASVGRTHMVGKVYHKVLKMKIVIFPKTLAPEKIEKNVENVENVDNKGKSLSMVHLFPKISTVQRNQILVLNCGKCG